MIDHPSTPLYKYQAFISYSHRADSAFARRLQRLIERLAKPWYRRRSIALFRDETDLAVNPGIWPKLVEALDASEHLVLFGSPSAAESDWVTREVEHWKSKRDPSRLIIALTDGAVVWDEAAQDFDWNQTNALPRSLAGAFKNEPLWADFRGATSATNDAGEFREPAIRLAAALRGVPPRDLESEDLRYHRRTIRLATTALVVMLGLTVAAVIATVQAIQQRNLATSRELAALSAAQLAVDPDLSVSLALHAREVVPTFQADRALRTALAVSHARRRFQSRGLYLNAISFSSDGKRFITSSGWSFLGNGVDLQATVCDSDTGKSVAMLPHTTPVRKGVFSPDGRRVLTMSDGPTAYLWEADTGVRIAELRAHQNDIASVAFSPDGSRIATAGKDAVVYLWNVASLTTPIPLKQLDAVNDVQFSPDGLSVVTAAGQWRVLDSLGGLFTNKANRFTVGVWDVRSGSERFRLPPFSAPVLIARFSPDGARLVTVSGDNIARVWNARDGTRISELRGHTDSITALAIGMDSHMIATASGDASARLWDADTGALRVELHGHKQWLHSVAISPDGRTIVTGGGDSFAIVWDVYSGKPLGELRGHEGPITAIAFTPDGRSIATTSHDGTVRLWRIPPGTVTEPLGPVGSVEKMALSTDGERILVENSNREVSVWHRRTGARLAMFGPAATFTRPAWSADGTRILIPLDFGAVIYAVPTSAVLKRFETTSTEFRVAALSPDGARIGSYDGSTHVLAISDVASGVAVARVHVDMSIGTGGLEFSPDGNRLLALQFAVGGGELREAKTLAVLATFKGRTIRFSKSGDKILEFGGEDSLPRVYDSRTGKLLTAFRAAESFHPGDVAFGPGEEQIFAADHFGTALIWNVSAVDPVATFHLPFSLFGRLVFSPDDRLIAVTGTPTVAVWDARSRSQIEDLRGHSQDVTTAEFSRDGLVLVTASKDGTVRVYPSEAFVPMQELVARAEGSLSRRLSLSDARNLAH
jgi:WD40 repeat protein